MKVKLISFLLISYTLVGCAELQDLKVAEVRQDKYYYRTTNLNKSLEDLSRQLKYCNLFSSFRYRRNKDPQLVINPDKVTGTMVIDTSGFFDKSTLAVVDFKEESKNNTSLKIYAVADRHARLADRLIESLTEDAHKCPLIN